MNECSRLPARLVAGTSFALRIADPDHSAADGWSAQLLLRGPSAPEPVTRETTEAEDHLFLGAADWSGPLLPGSYVYQVIGAHETEGTEILQSGRILVTPNLLTAAAGALQSDAEREYALVTALIEGRSLPNEDLEGYTIDGTAYNLVPLEKLWERQRTLRARIARSRGGSLGVIRLSVGVR